MSKFDELRIKFPVMTYEGFETSIQDDHYRIVYNFNTSDIHYFNPIIKIPISRLPDAIDFNHQDIQLLLFSIGMVEFISYWKATCSPTVIIKPASLTNDQISWWKKLYFNGLGEFFFLNNINTTIDSFMNIIPAADAKHYNKASFNVREENLIPIGGGKDSIVTLSLLEEFSDDNFPFIINPRGASLESAIHAGYPEEKIITISRIIDKHLLELNAQGFLNGHTPFSAALAFTSLLIAALTGKKYIVLSNEESANEATVSNTNINHQYSKSFEFECDFQHYVSTYITNDIHYFSLLRGYNEYKITSLFASLTDFHSVFKSCNVGSKENKWCAHCAKCLFVYIMLSAHLSQDELIKIFGANLLDDASLLKEFNELTGIAQLKPFECVGTTIEVNAALTIFCEKNNQTPALVSHWLKHPNLKLNKKELNKIVMFFNHNHAIPTKFFDTLK